MKTLLEAKALRLNFGAIAALDDVSLDVTAGEVVAIVGESGSGKTTLLRVLAGQMAPDSGAVHYLGRDVLGMTEAERRRLMRSDWGFVHQNPRDGLRMGVSAGGNVGERLMALGARHYGNIRDEAKAWLQRVEIDAGRIDDLPRHFSGGMQQRLQIARTLVTRPKLVFMDEPTGGLLGLSVLIVTHDIAAARLLADRILVMRRGQVVEQGLTDRVLDDPQHPYTQLLVSSVLAA
jgi:putative phosphonate transport system ATP-binding protein